MARYKRGARSQAIRDYVARNPGAGPSQVVKELKQQGIVVKAGLVSSIKYGKRSTSGRRRAPALRAAARRTAATRLTVEQLIEVKRLADSLGGTDRVRQALDALGQLQ